MILPRKKESNDAYVKWFGFSEFLFTCVVHLRGESSELDSCGLALAGCTVVAGKSKTAAELGSLCTGSPTRRMPQLAIWPPASALCCSPDRRRLGRFGDFSWGWGLGALAGSPSPLAAGGGTALPLLLCHPAPVHLRWFHRSS